MKYDICPIFVTYIKAEDMSETLNYDDHFINRETSSPELEPLINYNGIDAQLFIQKSNDGGIEFYKTKTFKCHKIHKNKL